jgi:hypothetical protein
MIKFAQQSTARFVGGPLNSGDLSSAAFDLDHWKAVPLMPRQTSSKLANSLLITGIKQRSLMTMQRPLTKLQNKRDDPA